MERESYLGIACYDYVNNWIEMFRNAFASQSTAASQEQSGLVAVPWFFKFTAIEPGGCLYLCHSPESNSSRIDLFNQCPFRLEIAASVSGPKLPASHNASLCAEYMSKAWVKKNASKIEGWYLCKAVTRVERHEAQSGLMKSLTLKDFMDKQGKVLQRNPRTVGRVTLAYSEKELIIS